MVSYRMTLAALGLTASTVLASPIVTKRGDTSGCGQIHHNGYNTNGGSGFPLPSNGIDRTYTIRVPDNYDQNRQYPLIIDYHGNGGSSDSQYGNSR
jgi:poly(3-hydroxybutyrate) depolymerase